MSTPPRVKPQLSRASRIGMLIVFLTAAIAAGIVGTLLQGDDAGAHYLALDRPPWAPPAWLFGVVWPVLYVLIGLAAWVLWRRTGDLHETRLAHGLWAGQLIVNAAWPGVFFGLEALWPAAAVLAVLVGLVVATIAAFARHDRLSAWLLVPYVIWIVYATALNVALAVAS